MTAPSGTGLPAASPPDHLDDGVIMERSLGDPEQFAIVFRRHAAQIQRYAVRRLGADAGAEVMAETFLAAFAERGSYRPDRADARPWLYGIASNLIGRHRRAEVRAYRALARMGLDPVTAPFSDRVDEIVSADGCRVRLASALAKLPAGHRDVLLLVAWGGLSYEQVAEALDVPLGTVRSRLSRARRSLRRALGGVDPSAVAEGLRVERDGQGDRPPSAIREEAAHE